MKGKNIRIRATLFLKTEAIAKHENGEKAMVLIFASGKSVEVEKPSLLQLDLEEKLNEYQNITVKTVFFVDGEYNHLKELTIGCDNIFIDEMFADIETLTQNSQNELKQLFASKQTVWISPSNEYYDSRLDSSIDSEQWVKSKYPEEFQVAVMKTPLRIPGVLAKNIKSGYSGISKATPLKLNWRLMAECKVPSNLSHNSAVFMSSHHTAMH